MIAADDIISLFVEIHDDLKPILSKYRKAKFSKTDKKTLNKIIKNIQELRIKLNTIIAENKKQGPQQDLSQYFNN